MLEEKSAAVLLDNMLPRLFPDLNFICLKHEGKQDLEKSIARKLKGWTTPGDKFVVVRDNDNEDSNSLRTKLSTICATAGRPDALIRLACQELEAWYFGDLKALANAFNDQSLIKIGSKAKYRDPDKISKPSHELEKICQNFQKISGARAIAPHLNYIQNTSKSFCNFIEGIKELSGL